MTDLLLYLYYLLHPAKENALLQRYRIYSLGRFSLRLLGNVLIPLSYILNPSTKYKTDANSTLIVTLTSFPQRIGKLWMVIESVLRQSKRPGKVLLWLSKVQFPNGNEDLPKRLIDQCKRGLEIHFVDGDIRSHKKYLYTVQQYMGADIVTVDDDIFYDRHLLENLWKQHELYPNDVIAAYTHQMTFDEDGDVLPYSRWSFHSTAAKNLFFGSGGGALFPVGSLYKDVCNIEDALRTCPVADDIWLNAQVRLSGVHIRRIPTEKPYRFLEVIRLHDVNLSDDNVMQGNRNDDQLNNVIELYEKADGRSPFEKEK